MTHIQAVTETSTLADVSIVIYLPSFLLGQCLPTAPSPHMQTHALSNAPILPPCSGIPSVFAHNLIPRIRTECSNSWYGLTCVHPHALENSYEEKKTIFKKFVLELHACSHESEKRKKDDSAEVLRQRDCLFLNAIIPVRVANIKSGRIEENSGITKPAVTIMSSLSRTSTLTS